MQGHGLARRATIQRIMTWRQQSTIDILSENNIVNMHVSRKGAADLFEGLFDKSGIAHCLKSIRKVSLWWEKQVTFMSQKKPYKFFFAPWKFFWFLANSWVLQYKRITKNLKEFSRVKKESTRFSKNMCQKIRFFKHCGNRSHKSISRSEDIGSAIFPLASPAPFTSGTSTTCSSTSKF